MLVVRRSTAMLVLAAAFCLALPVSAFSYVFGPWVESTGFEETVYDWDWDTNRDGDADPGERIFSCAAGHSGDGNVHAFRDASNRIQLIIPTGGGNRRMLGTNFDNLSPEQHWVDEYPDDARPCGPDGLGNVLHPVRPRDVAGPTPDQFHGTEWFGGAYRTFEGGPSGRIYVLVHDEYHAHDDLPANDDGVCSLEPRGDYAGTCGRISTTLLYSDDNGRTYNHLRDPPSHLVATVPFQPFPGWTHEEVSGFNYSSGNIPGLGSPTNIVQAPNDGRPGRDGLYYAILNSRNEGYPIQEPRQKGGGCLIRTDTLGDPSSWRGWGAFDRFTRTFVSPYPEEPDPVGHVCEPVADRVFLGGGFVPHSLTYDTHLDRFVLVGNASEAGTGQTAIFYTLSDDLVNWSAKQLLIKSEPPPSGQCAHPITYPSLIDHADPTINFERPGPRPHVYYTYAGTVAPNEQGECEVPFGDSGRDLDTNRMPLRFKFRQATVEGQSVTDPTTGYDSVGGMPGTFSSVNAMPGMDAYDGSKYANAMYAGGGNAPHGQLNVSWPEGSDVWYSSAFFLPSGFAASHGNVDIMRWENANGTRYGGIALRSDDHFRLVRGKTGGPEEELGPTGPYAFSLPEGKWFFLEVHQRLSTTSTGVTGAVNEVFLNGQLYLSSITPNAYPNSDGAPARVRFGFAAANQPMGSMSMMRVDRSALSESQRGAVGAPSTPTEWNLNAQPGVVNIYWRPVSGASLYRVYRRDSGRWIRIKETPNFAHVDPAIYSCNNPNVNYRITSVNATGIESLVSSFKTVRVPADPGDTCP